MRHPCGPSTAQVGVGVPDLVAGNGRVVVGGVEVAAVAVDIAPGSGRCSQVMACRVAAVCTERTAEDFELGMMGGKMGDDSGEDGTPS